MAVEVVDQVTDQSDKPDQHWGDRPLFLSHPEPMTSYSISDLNQMSQSAFVEVLGAVFENTPAIAVQAWNQRPFINLDHLYQTLIETVHLLSLDEQLALIRAHPNLGSRAQMADASVKEQAGVGLNRLTAEEYRHFQILNQSYKTKFRFPFIIAVKGHTKISILKAFEQRLDNTLEVEQQRALSEIAQIVKFRLTDLLIS